MIRNENGELVLDSQDEEAIKTWIQWSNQHLANPGVFTHPDVTNLVEQFNND